MYRHLSRAPIRTLSGHVCLSCRRHLHVTLPRRKDDFADDWLSNFNDLSIEDDIDSTRTPPPKDALKGQERKPDSPAQKVKTNGLKGSKAKLDRAKDDKSNRKAKIPPLDDVSSHALEGIPKSSGGAGHASDEVRERYEAVLQRILSEDPAYRAIDTTVDQSWPGRRRLPIRSHASDAGSNSNDPLPADRFSYSGSDVLVPHIRRENIRKIPVHGKSAFEVVHPADVELGKAADIAAKTQVVRERPKWGGKTAASLNAPFNASFNSLQRADKVSPPRERPSTATSAKPFGFQRHEDTGFADSPGDLVAGLGLGQTHAASASPTSDTPQPGPFRTLVDLSNWGRMMQTNDPTYPGKHAKSEESKTASDSEIGKIKEQDANAQPPDVFPEPSKQLEAADADASPPKRKGSTIRRARHRAARQARKLEAKLAEKSRQALLSDETENLGSPLDADQAVGALEIQGQSMSEAMVGREIADAMSSEQEFHSNTRERLDVESMSDMPMIWPKDLKINPLNIEQLPVPSLSYGLDRVLFNPGVTSLQDQHSRVYNFDPFLQNIMPVEEFDFNALKEYKTSSQDSTLYDLAKAQDKKYVGSTSSMTSTLSHFHYLLSGWRELNTSMLSRQFPDDTRTFTRLNRAPTAIFLRYKNGSYAIDADKEHDSGNILMMLGKSMEKLLTMSSSEYERYRKSDPREITQAERDQPETYEYTTMGDMLMRSQLDAHDARLPGTGTFDIKTRAIASIRMSSSDYKPMLGYEILTQQGKWESYEREYYDMMRSTMLKYSLQARMGRMDGIFLAYHNIERIFGFQYMPMSELDRVLHGQNDTCLGDQEFKLSVDLLNKVLNEATAKFPNKSLRFHFETRDSPVTAMYIFAEPMEEAEIDKIQAKGKDKLAKFERKMMGIEPREKENIAEQEGESPDHTLDSLLEPMAHAPLYAATIIVASRVNGHHVERPEHLRPNDDWSVEYLLKEMDNPAAAWATLAQLKAKRKKEYSRYLTTVDEDGAESPEDMEPNLGMHEKDGSLRTFDGFYLENLRKMAAKGRDYRQKIDQHEKDHGKVVYGQTAAGAGIEVEPTTTQQQSASESNVEQASTDPEITGVDDYMSWMYSERRLW